MLLLLIFSIDVCPLFCCLYFLALSSLNHLAFNNFYFYNLCCLYFLIILSWVFLLPSLLKFSFYISILVRCLYF